MIQFLLLYWRPTFTLGVVLVMLYCLIRGQWRSELVIVVSLASLVFAGILNPSEAFSGLSNPALLSVAFLFILAEGVQRSGALSQLDRLLFTGNKKTPLMLLRLMFSCVGLSAFLNNTPIVAMLTPRVQKWAERNGIAPSKLLIPLSYATILGGTITLIGTSTNLVVSGWLRASGLPELSFFELTPVALPAALLTIVYFVTVGHRFLPERRAPGSGKDAGLKNCLFEVKISNPSPFVGCTLEQAGLRALGKAYLAHLQRGEHLVPSSPNEILQAGDILTFVGELNLLENLLQRRGLEKVILREKKDDQGFPIFEAVLSKSSRLVGKTLKDARFRDRYQGVVLAIQRQDAQLEGALGQISLEAGDLLLIEAHEDFDSRWNQDRNEFFLVSPRKAGAIEASNFSSFKIIYSALILLVVIVVSALGIIPMVTATFAGALAIILGRVLDPRSAGQALNLPVLLVIAAALGIGKAVENSGLAGILAQMLLPLSEYLGPSLGPIGILAAIYLSTVLLTELVTNNAAALVMLPIAVSTAKAMNYAPHTFAIAVAIAASASFMTPLGYQTNLMVMGPGGYRFSDFLKAGFPVSLIVFTVTMITLSIRGF